MADETRPPNSGPTTDVAPSWFSDLMARTGFSAPVPTITYGSRLSQYPTPADIANARTYGVGYGTGNEGFIEGQTARGWSVPRPGEQQARPIGIQDVPNAGKLATDPQLNNPIRSTQELMDNYMAAQLAILRSPISALGYDPRKAAMDLKSGKNVSVAGIYSPDKDSIYSNLDFPSNIVHESTHRGLKMLRDAGVVPKSLWERLPGEESIVRYIMAFHMGDPEKGRGEESEKERSGALWTFGKSDKDPQKERETTGSARAKEHRAALEELNAIAAKFFASKQPGGGVIAGGPK